MKEIYKVQVGMDILVIRPDGSIINFGDAIYHNDRIEEAIAYVNHMNKSKESTNE